MPPRRPDEQVTLPRDVLDRSYTATTQVAEALGAATEVVERAEAALLQAQADRVQLTQTAMGLADQLERATRKLDAHPTLPPPALPLAPGAALAHAVAGWAPSPSGRTSLSFLAVAFAAFLAAIAGALGYDGPLPLPGSTP